MATVDEAAAAAGALFWVDQAGQQVQNVADAAAQQAVDVWRDFTDWYTAGAVRERAAQAAAISVQGQDTVTQIMAQYLGEVTAIIHDRRRIDVPNISTPTIRNGADLTTVHSRAAKAYRIDYAATQSTEAALEAAFQREMEAIETDIMLATRQAQDDAMQELAVKHYRRVLHPELSRTGSCGLCLAASLKVYNVGDLMPIHVHCKCLTMPIINGVDPAKTINEDDRKAAYAELGETERARLSNTRVQVHEHGELGPVLTVKGQKFTGPSDLADKGAGDGGSGGGSGLSGAPDDDGSRRLPADQSVVFPGAPPRDTSKAVQSVADLDERGLIAGEDTPHVYFNANEQPISDWLESRGIAARSVRDLQSPPRTPDAVLEDFAVTCEFKALLSSGSDGAIRQAIRSGRGQSRRVIIDGRPQNVTAGTAAAGIKRALGQYAADLDGVIVILGDGTSVGWWNGQR